MISSKVNMKMMSQSHAVLLQIQRIIVANCFLFSLQIIRLTYTTEKCFNPLYFFLAAHSFDRQIPARIKREGAKHIYEYANKVEALTSRLVR